MASRAVGYVRVSDESQVEGLSLDAQRREIERYCERHGHELEGFYADEGVSAHGEEIASRPQLVRLLDDAAAAAFDIVVVHTLDRWARNVGVQRQALKRLGDAGVGFASVTEQVDFTTPAGKLMLTMIGGVSEFFSDQLGVLVAKAKREQAERGLPPGPVPFGYIRTASRICLPDERDGQAVRRVFEVRAAGSSHGETAAWLNAQGFRTRTDRLFTPYATRDMSANVFLRGRRQVQRGTVPRTARENCAARAVPARPAAAGGVSSASPAASTSWCAPRARRLRRLRLHDPLRAEPAWTRPLPRAARRVVPYQRPDGGC